MSEAVTVALVSGGLTLLGTIITVVVSSRRTQATIQTEIAVTRTEVEQLKNEVEKHNNFATRVPVLEAHSVATDKRLEKLEEFHMG